MGRSAGLRRAERLRRPRDFRRVLAEGARVSVGRFVVLVALCRPEPHQGGERVDPLGSRLGITASRKVGSAVRRNRAKRLIREWFRHSKREIGGGLDVVVIARPGAARLTGADVAETLQKGVERARRNLLAGDGCEGPSGAPQ